ncbi:MULTISPECIES: hypothetical protein [Pontibacter]|nr:MULTISPECIES: hypothetical protein [Pontibacter]
MQLFQTIVLLNYKLSQPFLFPQGTSCKLAPSITISYANAKIAL